MKKIIFCFLAACLLIAFNMTFALSDKNIKFLNHYNHSLNGKITINPQVLPDLPSPFVFAQNQTLHSRLLDLKKEAYISLRDETDAKKSAFFGVEIVNDMIRFHGYIGKGIAYSWKDDTITFCTPEEYQKKKSCT